MPIRLEFLSLLFAAIAIFTLYPIAIFAKPFLITVTIVACAVFFLRSRLKPLAAQRDELRPFWIASVLFVISAIYLEWREPLYFLRSDNKVMFYPVITFAAESFFNGTFPTWNPYQFMGQPLLGSGLYALNYPPIYLSYWIAKYILGNDRALFEVFGWGHLALGFLIYYRWLRQEFEISTTIASLSSLTFALSGFLLIAGRDWYYMLPLAVWLPLIFSFYTRWIKAPSLFSGALLGASAGFLIHAGNAQMWFYTCLLLLLAGFLFLLSGKMNQRHWTALGVGTLLFTIVAAPTLIAQLQFGAQAGWQSTGDGILYRLNALLLPSPFVQVPHPNNWGAYSFGNWTAFFFVGYASFIAAIAWVTWYGVKLFQKKQDCLLNQHHHFVWLFLFCFGCALGPTAIFWKGFSCLPIISKFAQPFKFLAFLCFLTPLLGALAIDRLAGAWPMGRKIFMVLMLASLTLHLPQTTANYDYFQDGNFPELPERLRPFLMNAGGRILSFSPSQPTSENYYDTVPHNLATRYRLFHRGGYDGLVELHPESFVDGNPKYWSDYGIQWIIVAASERQKFADLRDLPSLKKVISDDTIDLYELKNAQPIVAVSNGTVIDKKIGANGISMRLDSHDKERTVTLNFLNRKNLKVMVDGSEVAVKTDPLRRIQVKIPPGKTKVQAIFSPNYRAGHFIVGVLGILGICLLL